MPEAQQAALLPVNPTGDKCKKCVFTDGSQNTSPAQASLVIVVGSLVFALCTRTKEVFLFLFFSILQSRGLKFKDSEMALIYSPPLYKTRIYSFLLICLLMYDDA